MSARISFRLWLCTALVLASCATTEKVEEEVLAASPAPDAGFLEGAEKMTPHPDRSPFDRAWLAPGFSYKNYSKMYVAHVDTHHVLNMSIWEQINIRSIDVKQDISDLAVELHDKVEKAFGDDPTHHFEVLKDPAKIDEKTLVVQLALVEVVPNKAALGVLATAAWAAPVAVGIPVGTIAAFTDQGSISFEGRARDGRTGEVVAMCADREIGPMRVVDVRSMTWYGNAHEIIDGWANQLVELSNTSPDVKVEHSPYFTLLPW
jgi:hypothetical protein